MTHTALLRGIRALDRGSTYSSLRRLPGNFLWNTCKVGGAQIGIHCTGLELHRGDGQLFVSDLGIRVLIQADIDRTIDLLAHMMHEPLPALAARGGQLLHALLFEARSQFGFAAALLAVTLLSLTQVAVKGAVVLTVAACQEVSDADINADHLGIWLGLDSDLLIIGESEPPAIGAPVQSHATVDGFTCQYHTMIRR